MKNYFKTILPLLILLAAAIPANALQIVYPKTPNTEVSAASTFFVGNTNPEASLKINDKEVKIFDNGSFVEVVPLKDGFNRIIIDSKAGTEHDIMTYIIKRVPPKSLTIPEAELIEFPQNEFIYAATVKGNTPLRAQPDEYAQRITHLDSNIVLMINGKKGDFFRVSLTPEKNVWVRADSVVTYSTINSKMLANIDTVSVCEDALFEYIKTKISFAAPYKITETDTGLSVDLYNIKENNADTTLFKPTSTLKSLAINQIAPENKSTYFVELNHRLWGYDAYYENGYFVIKIRKKPQIDAKQPLKGLTVALDAGHGADDAGAIGPTGVKEKDINLDIANRLKSVLEKAGASVVMTREDDTNPQLYDRIKTAKESNALFLISLHANALKDGGNPYEKHGTAVFYYNAQTVDFAKIIRDTLTKELQTKDDGVGMYSLVVTRPTMPLSVLVEVAYMIHPEEYKMLLDEKFRQKSAEAIKNALETYVKTNCTVSGTNYQ